ncbi:MAG: sugar phosphate nucleotidyltransferase [Candidatus Curtissbacteria bacterium]|nr:sugar phosphate nucleotidyltransferase [Candidatus Curtissbacteria bacterium]
MESDSRSHNDLKIALFCGGTGTRMWPASRREKPKQFQPLVGRESMFQQAVRRIKKGFPIKDVFVITGRPYVGLVVQQAPDLPLENVIIEPEMRDTLAAVGYAAAVLDKKFKNPIVASLWAADHLVKNGEEFIKALKAAYEFVENTGKIVSIDVRPTYPNIHVGYIQIGKMIKKLNSLAFFEYVKHIEKPDLATAKKLVVGWEYLWHAGYKVWRTQKMLSLYKKHTPKVYDGLIKIQKSWGSDNQEETVKKIYPDFEKISVDYAIFEKMSPEELAVLSADLGWSDIGAWNVLKDELSENANDNVVQGDVFDIDSRDCLIYANTPDKVVATIGLEGLIIVDTPDGLLVSHKDRISEVKKIIEKLKEAKKDKYL